MSDKIEEDQEEPIVIDLEELKKNQLNESYLSALGWQLQAVIKQMMGISVWTTAPFVFKGKPDEIAKFANTVGKERRYLQSVKKHGLDNPKTYTRKSRLTKAVSAFERTTGIKWPFK